MSGRTCERSSQHCLAGELSDGFFFVEPAMAFFQFGAVGADDGPETSAISSCWQARHLPAKRATGSRVKPKIDRRVSAGSKAPLGLMGAAAAIRDARSGFARHREPTPSSFFCHFPCFVFADR